MSSNLRHHLSKRPRTPISAAAALSLELDTSMDLDPLDPLFRFDPLRHLPLELTHKILLLLTSRQLCTVCSVSRRWKKVVHVDLNPYWWGLCMERFWVEHARPKCMTKVDKKRDWKKVWVDVLKKESAGIMGQGLFETEEEGSESWRQSSLRNNEIAVPRWDDRPATKLEMRAHYKSIRPKPKGKKPEHVPREWYCE
ncbi:hypothetical protein BC937DRAFT_89369 [Endogone sp. FLAS-F59071]|nr:hypothetical protein BC937DRAFT_89369 [Endogone sp. FLAS-F59071]|eukprot:RUS17895.1 hypothetical protein BC937DRAFT_89369 [Endogone sp. FLAS-F59071]